MPFPCAPWITEQDLADCNCPDASTTQIDAAILEAQSVLYAATGQRFTGSTCTAVLRPYRVTPHCGHTDCQTETVVTLPYAPINSVTEVKIDGAVFTGFRLDKPDMLRRTDNSVWPFHQNLLADSATEIDTWQISYVYGTDPPAELKTAAAVLATELVKACTSDKTCRIPAGAVTVSRRGISYNIDVGEGKTGIYEVDLIVSALNPKHRRRQARITSTDDTQFVVVG